jgi:hypothetical protein
MDKVVQGYGGKEAIEKIKDLELKGTASLMGQNLDIAQTRVLPGNAIMTMSMGGMVMSKQALVNGNYSVTQQGQEAPITPEVKESLEEATFIVPEMMYLQKGYQLKIIGAEKVEGKDAIDVEVKTPSGKASHRFYDATTYLLLKTSVNQEVPGRGSVTQQQFYKSYKIVEGLNVASEQVLDLGQIKLNINYTAIKVNQGLKSTDLK